MTGKVEVNDVFLLEGRFVLKSVKADKIKLNKNIETINSLFLKNKASTLVAIVPSACEIYNELLPKSAPKTSQKNR